MITDYEKLIMMAAGYKSIKEYIDAFTVNKERFLCFFDKNFKDCTTETEGTSVTLSTIHSAKGLEWKNVFIIGMNDQNFPGIKKYDNPHNRQGASVPYRRNSAGNERQSYYTKWQIDRRGDARVCE